MERSPGLSAAALDQLGVPAARHETLAASKVEFRRFEAAFEYRGDRPTRLLLAGTYAAAADLIRLFRSARTSGITIVGLVQCGEATAREIPGAPTLGGIDEVERILDTWGFDEVVMASAEASQQDVNRLLGACLERGLSYHTLVRMPGHIAGRQENRLAEGLWVASVHSPRIGSWPSVVKRAVDLTGGIVGLLACGAVYLIVAPLIRLTSPGPAIFKQTRVGKGGRSFTLYKFRTMTRDAEALRPDLQASPRVRGPLFKLDHDPRITPIGRFLRKTYLDELPQFLNVLKGDMSLVGTRPPTPDEVALYMPHHRRRLSVRPGITGLWQSMGDEKVWDFDIVVSLDCEYIDHWSLWLDIRILVRTLGVVVRATGH